MAKFLSMGNSSRAWVLSKSVIDFVIVLLSFCYRFQRRDSEASPGVSMLQAMVVNRKDGKGANKIEQNASNTCIPCSKPYRFPAQTTRKHPKPLSFFLAPYRFTGLRDCPTQCARLLHPASTRVLPVPQLVVPFSGGSPGSFHFSFPTELHSVAESAHLLKVNNF